MRISSSLASDRDCQNPAYEPTDDGFERDRFPERHEVPLAIELRRCGSDADDAVVIARRSTGLERGLGREQPDDRVAFSRNDGRDDAQQHRIGNLVGEHRKRALRQHDESPPTRFDEIGVELEGPRGEVGIELQVLRDIALDERHREWLAGLDSPFAVQQYCAPGDGQHCDAEEREGTTAGPGRQSIDRKRECRSDDRHRE